VGGRTSELVDVVEPLGHLALAGSLEEELRAVMETEPHHMLLLCVVCGHLTVARVDVEGRGCGHLLLVTWGYTQPSVSQLFSLIHVIDDVLFRNLVFTTYPE